MGVSEKDSPPKTRVPAGLSMVQEVWWALAVQRGVNKLSSDLLMYLEAGKQRGVKMAKAKTR